MSKTRRALAEALVSWLVGVALLHCFESLSAQGALMSILTILVYTFFRSKE